MRALTTLLCAALAVGCSGQVAPAALDTRNDQCGTCRMTVSAERTASQVVARNQEPTFFDDLGCLDRFLASSPLPGGARVFVADHRTGEWVAAEVALFTRINRPIGAMGSPLIAHVSASSRDADPQAAGFAVPLSQALPAFRRSGGSQ